MANDNFNMTSMKDQARQENNGFTLIELIIAVAIIGILAAIAIPAYKGYVKVAKKKSAESVLEQIPVLIESYRAENAKMCPNCDSNLTGTHTYIYRYTEDGTTGNEDTTPAADKFTTFFPDFRAKGLTADVSLYHYQIVFTVTGGTGSAVSTAIPQTGRGAPPGNIVGDAYE